MANQTAAKWIISAAKTNPIEYILSIDDSDPEKDEYIKGFGMLECLLSHPNIEMKIIVSPNNTAIDAINKAALTSVNNLIIVVSDDFDCFEGWDTWLIDKLANRADYLVKTTDGIQQFLITLPIMDRMYYNRFGYVYYPEYRHMFCDTEMTDVGNILGRVIDLKDEGHKFTHKHYIAGLMEKDAINIKNDATWAQGEKLYNERKALNFFI
jgi:hypothetical protein